MKGLVLAGVVLVLLASVLGADWAVPLGWVGGVLLLGALGRWVWGAVAGR